MSDEAFWTSSAQLGRIRDVARGRLVAPWAVFAGVLALTCSRVGPHVVLPPIVGGHASLNTFWGLVGPSGAGKDAALAVARSLLYLPDFVPTHEVGTGQGIDAMYTAQTKQGPVQFCDAALWTLTEIDTLAAHAAMGGANVMATLRKVYSAAALGSAYADKFKRRPVREHCYRFALVAGIQPARSGILLNDSDGGTPQRWIWMPALDPVGAAQPYREPEPFDPSVGALWTPQSWHAPIGDTKEVTKVERRPVHELAVCDAARSAIVEARRARLSASLTAEVDPTALDGHALLTRVKVAALLGIFHRGDGKVSDEDWQLAGIVMAVSDQTRKVCADALANTSRRVNRGRAEQEAERAGIVAEQAEVREFQAATRWVNDWLRARPGKHTRGDINRAANSRVRPWVDQALEHLVGIGFVRRERRDYDPFGETVRDVGERFTYEAVKVK